MFDLVARLLSLLLFFFPADILVVAYLINNLKNPSLCQLDSQGLV